MHSLQDAGVGRVRRAAGARAKPSPSRCQNATSGLAELPAEQHRLARRSRRESRPARASTSFSCAPSARSPAPAASSSSIERARRGPGAGQLAVETDVGRRAGRRGRRACARRRASSAQRCRRSSSIVRRGHLGVRLARREARRGVTPAETSRLGRRESRRRGRLVGPSGPGLQSARRWATRIRASSPASGEEGPRRFYGFEEDVSDVAVPDVLPDPAAARPRHLPVRHRPAADLARRLAQARRGPPDGDRTLGLVSQKNPEDEQPEPDGLYSRGTAGRILKMLKYPDGSVRILVQGLRRIEVLVVRAAPAVSRGPRPPAARRARAVAGPRGDAGRRGEPVREVRLDDPLPARRAAGRRDEHQGPGQGLRPHRVQPEHLARGEAGAASRRSTSARGSSGSRPSSAARSSCSSWVTRSSRRSSPS